MTTYSTVDDVRYRSGGDNGILRHVLFEEWQSRCYWCETPVLFASVEIDHILPHTATAEHLADLIRRHDLPADFDVHAPANLAPICGRCNREKSNNRFAGTLVTGKLARAAKKQDRVIQRVLAFATAHQRAAHAVAADQALRSPAEVLARIRMLTERVQAFSDTWRQDVTTTADGIALLFTPKTAHQEPGLPPLFDLSADDPATDEVGRGLTEVRDYGGAVVIDGRYLIPPDDSATSSIAEVLGLTGPDDQVLIAAVGTQLDPATTFHLALVTAGGAVRDRLPLHADSVASGQRGARMILRDGVGLFTACLQAEHPDNGGTITTHLTSTSLAGHYPYQLLAALQLFRDAEPTDRLEVRLNDRPLGSPVDVDAEQMGQILLAFRYDGDLITALDRVQAHTGQRFPVPEQITAKERTDLLLAARLLDGKAITLTDDVLTLTVKPDAIGAFLQDQHPGQPGELTAVGAEYAVTCGEHRMALGPVTIRAPQVTLVNADEMSAAATAAPVKARYQCLPGAKIAVHLASVDAPDGRPAKAAADYPRF
ncbi:HNH endonuclease [Plantactinospora alkalitolerans]|uniref:HNH endonuclease n=1 Tax=Plantactinospora alkalitolerans TaxID=2789879 RepID=UPI0018AD081B|nr:HNH endonuclease signature motif containing protein [Plantactinospora alkalitolerans]